MSIENFPANLQAMVQTGYLEHKFEEGLTSLTAYRRLADRMTFSAKVGDSITRTRPGLKAPATTPLNMANNTGLDNGLTPTGWTLEQFTVTLQGYGDTLNLNTVTEKVGIVSQFPHNAYVNGVQAAQTLDRLARDTASAAAMAGNTYVRVALTSAGTSIAVDDIRGFQWQYVNGVQTPISPSNTLTVTINGAAYTVSGATPDATSVSQAPNGVSGTLTTSASVSTANGALNAPVLAYTASSIVRPNGRTATSNLVTGDELTMDSLLDSVARLRSNAAPMDDGAYNCFLDPTSSRQLFSDPDFRQLFQGATSSNAVFREAVIAPMLGLRFIPTTEAYLQALAGQGTVHRVLVAAKGALIEGDFEGMESANEVPSDSIVTMHDGIVHITRPPIDRFNQIIAQSWYWIGGFCAPTDATANTVIPTASNANYKRMVMIEHIA